jgi:cephalosporin hydroxylase
MLRRIARSLRFRIRRIFIRPRAEPARVGPNRAPTGISPLTSKEQAIVDAFHKLYYEQRVEGRQTVLLRYLGWRILKCPFDLWTYQEIVVDTRPELIVECGTRYGGGALYLAHLFDLMGGSGEVLTIDIDTTQSRPVHPRIRYVAGSTTDPAIVTEVRRAAAGKRTMVILDSDHAAAQVRAELALYPEFVTAGCYLIVDDTDLGGNPVWPEFGEGPMTAVEEFLKRTTAFVSDLDRERFMLTLNPRGFLRRVS